MRPRVRLTYNIFNLYEKRRVFFGKIPLVVLIIEKRQRLTLYLLIYFLSLYFFIVLFSLFRLFLSANGYETNVCSIDF